MEKWIRGLSKKNALIIGNLGLLIGLIICSIFYINMQGGFVFSIIFGALLGGTVGFAYPLFYKGITGYTPQEKREFSKNKG